MYDELITAIRKTACQFKECGMCPKGKGPCIDRYALQAADAIEECCQQVDKFAEEAARLYAKLPRWIPVTETPKLKVGDEGYTGYLVYANGFYEIGDYTTDKFGNLEYFHVDGELETDVTHYMPLPEPPKEDKAHENQSAQKTSNSG